MYTPLAIFFRIASLGGTSLAVLAIAGVLFAALSLLDPFQTAQREPV